MNETQNILQELANSLREIGVTEFSISMKFGEAPVTQNLSVTEEPETTKAPKAPEAPPVPAEMLLGDL